MGEFLDINHQVIGQRFVSSTCNKWHTQQLSPDCKKSPGTKNSKHSKGEFTNKRRLEISITVSKKLYFIHRSYVFNISVKSVRLLPLDLCSTACFLTKVNECST